MHRCSNLFVRKCFLDAPKICNVLVTRMRPDCDSCRQRLFDCRFHHRGIARMPTTRHIRRSNKAHQRHLTSVRQHLRHFAHVAIQIDLSHTKSFPSSANNACCSIHNDRACSKETCSKWMLARGRNCPSEEKSALMTFAIFGYPPVVCCSTNKMIACPDGVT